MNDTSAVVVLSAITTFWTVVGLVSCVVAIVYRKWYIREKGVSEAWRDNYMKLLQIARERK
jgi:hypothetical protein